MRDHGAVARTDTLMFSFDKKAISALAAAPLIISAYWAIGREFSLAALAVS